MREKSFRKQQNAAILSSVGMILVLAGLVMLSPLLIVPAYPQQASELPAFIVPAACLILIGMALRRLFRPAPGTTLSAREGGIIVLISWILAILFSALPFMIIQHLSFSAAVFESVSGWTTTGLSVIDVTQASRLVLFWRSAMQLAGGAGLAIIMMSAIVGPTSVGISTAEGRSDQLVPHVRQSARLVLIIYTGYAVIGTLAYWWAGMTLFDAVNHAFAAVSTGGFSTRPESIGFWNSAGIEAVTLVLMLLGNLSFVTAWFLWRGELRFVLRNGEVRLQAFLIPLSAAVVFLMTSRALYPRLGQSRPRGRVRDGFRPDHDRFFHRVVFKLERLRHSDADRSDADRRGDLFDRRRDQAIPHLFIVPNAGMGDQTRVDAAHRGSGAAIVGR